MPTITFTHERFHVTLDQVSAVLELLNESDMPNDDRGTIAVTVARPQIQASAPLATEVDVMSQVELGGPINDAAALAIAGWYQSPRGIGQTFNLLASGRPVAIDELLDAINVELTRPTDPAFARALEALSRWAELEVDQN